MQTFLKQTAISPSVRVEQFNTEADEADSATTDNIVLLPTSPHHIANQPTVSEQVRAIDVFFQSLVDSSKTNAPNINCLENIPHLSQFLERVIWACQEHGSGNLAVSICDYLAEKENGTGRRDAGQERQLLRALEAFALSRIPAPEATSVEAI
jgi:hypothetical protein